jgi:hypothetical protein
MATKTPKRDKLPKVGDDDRIVDEGDGPCPNCSGAHAFDGSGMVCDEEHIASKED